MNKDHVNSMIDFLKERFDYPPYFVPEEFQCRCQYPDCHKIGIQMKLVWRLSAVRILLGMPVGINSGWRCDKHNSDIGGKPNSTHLSGWAADIKAPAGTHRFELLEAALEVGFNRIGVYDWGLHLDMAPFVVDRVLWCD